MRCSKSGKGWVSRVSQAGPTGGGCPKVPLVERKHIGHSRQLCPPTQVGMSKSAKGQWICFNGYEDFGDPGQKWLRMARIMAQKAIRRLLSRSRWSPTGRIFDGFKPGSECHFFKNRSSGSSNFEILKVPKMARKRHNWIAELASFKMR